MIKRKVVEEMIKLKDGEYLDICYVNSKIINGELAIGCKVPLDFDKFTREYMEKILFVSSKLYLLFATEIKESIVVGNKEVLLIKGVITPSNYGFKVSLESCYIKCLKNEEGISNTKNIINEIIDEINDLSELLTKELNNIIDDSVEKTDVGEIKNFQLIYKGMSNKIGIHDFVRQSDRLITEQKKDIAMIIENGIDVKVYEMAKNQGYDLNKETVIIKFCLIDNEEIEILKVAYV